MKRKIFTLLLCALFGTAIMAQAPSHVIKKTTELPVLDGEIDAVWDVADQQNIAVPFQLEEPTLGNEGETWWKALWTDEGIYFLINVTDDEFYPVYLNEAGGNDYDHDKLELYFDCNAEKKDGLGAGNNQGHYQIAPGFTQDGNDGTVRQNNGADYAIVVTEPNYVAEYFVPMTKFLDKLGTQVAQTAEIGFDITVIDRETGDPARKRMNWANAGALNEAWNNMDDCGIITLEGGVDNILAEEMTITAEGGATTITTEAGTIQMVAEILPVSATVKSPLWVVENGTGRAYIDADGLLTGIIDGTVTVIATTKDGSDIEATWDVTISGQFVSMSDVNMIPNGNFNMVNDNGEATGWGGWGGSANSPMPQIVDGVAVCTPAAHAMVWQYQFSQSNLKCLPDVEYVLTFKAWADVDRDINFDFEDTPGNSYNRYGTDTETGATSDWTFGVTTVPTTYTFKVIFDKMVATTVQKIQFMLSTTADIVYLDDFVLVNALELPLVGIEVTGVTVKSAGDATTIETDKGTLQMSADILPVDAGYKEVAWSVENGTGMASISADGVLSAFANGTVTVVATAKDGSGVSATKEITLSNQIVEILNVDVTGAGFVTGDRVFVTGNPWGWTEPGKNAALEMFDTDGDGVYSITVSVCVPNMWNFKFFKNTGWSGGEPVSEDRAYTFAGSDNLTFTWGVLPEYVPENNAFPADFESDKDNTWGLFALGSEPFECSDFLAVPNPSVSGINTSAHVLQFVVNASADPWAGAWTDSYVPLNFTAEFHTLTMMVWKSVISPSALKVEKSTNGGPTLELKVSNTVTDAWELLTFDFSAGIGFSYPRWVFFPDFPDTRTAGTTVYLDNIGDVGVVSVSSKNINTVKVYPNPVSNELNVSLSSANAKVTIYNSLGRKMEEVIVKGNKTTFDVSSYASGLYFVKVNNDTIVKFVK